MRPVLPFLFLTLLFASLYASCKQQQTAPEETVQKPAPDFDLDTAREIIQEKTRLFTEAHITKDTAYLNNIFTDDARVLPPNAEAVVGKKAIALLNTDWVNYGIHEFTEMTTHFYGNEGYLIDEGTYFLRYDEENTVDNGKYINIWKNVNGEWKIYSNIWNTSLPFSE